VLLTLSITLYQCYLQSGIVYPYDGVVTLIALRVCYFDLEIKTVAVWFILTILAWCLVTSVLSSYLLILCLKNELCSTSTISGDEISHILGQYWGTEGLIMYTRVSYTGNELMGGLVVRISVWTCKPSLQ